MLQGVSKKNRNVFYLLNICVSGKERTCYSIDHPHELRLCNII